MPKLKPVAPSKKHQKQQPKPKLDKPEVESEPAPQSATSGGCLAWIRAAGIQDTASAKELIRRESNCNPLAINPTSGACGVGQALPCGKWGCQLGEGFCQVAQMHQYVLGRYGSWAQALAFHSANNWY